MEGRTSFASVKSLKYSERLRKLNSISDYVSKALEDDYISKQELSLVLRELEKFNNMKKEVRSKTKGSIDDETKQSFIGRK